MHYQRWKAHGDPRATMTPHRDDPYKRVMARTVREGDCLRFTGGFRPNGYGRVSVKDRGVSAHRIVAEHHLGPPPGDKPLVLHSCGNPWCVEIAHLRYGTYIDNAADRDLHGRTAVGARHGMSRENPRNK